jgi:hypothetical protein
LSAPDWPPLPASPHPTHHRAVGTWLVNVTPQNVPIPPFISTLAYTPGGIVIEATSKPHQTPTGQIADSTEGLGVWNLSPGSKLTILFHKHNFDAAGDYTGETTIAETDNLAASDDSYSGTADITITTPTVVTRRSKQLQAPSSTSTRHFT